MKPKTITTLGEARHASPVSFSVAENILVPADVEWTGRHGAGGFDSV